MFRSHHALVAVVALAAAPLLHAAPQSADDAYDRVCVRDASARAVASRPALAALFAAHHTDDPEVVTADGVSAPGTFEVLVARVSTDGKPVMACVDSEAAAKRFLDAPAASLPAKEGREQ
jgi:hypothetical protein